MKFDASRFAVAHLIVLRMFLTWYNEAASTRGKFNVDCHVSRQRSGSWGFGWPGLTLAAVLNMGARILLYEFTKPCASGRVRS